MEKRTVYIVAPPGTAAKDLGTREAIDDLTQAYHRAEGQELAVFSVTITVTQVTRNGQ